MAQLTGDLALMTAGARELRLAAEGRRHDRPIAFPSQRTTHSFKQSGQLRAPIRSSASARPNPRIP